MKKIALVLEDDESLREIFTILLEQEEFAVHTYPTVSSFKDGLKCYLPDVVVLDVNLPDGNGLEVCAQLKLDDQTRTVPVLMVSAHQDFTNTTIFPAADEYIAKPFDIDYFMNAVLKYT